MVNVPSRHAAGKEILELLSNLYNDIGCGSPAFAPKTVARYQWALLHCIAALHAIGNEPLPPPLRLVRGETPRAREMSLAPS